MARTRPEKEATLREVLGEVSLLDVGRLLKQTLISLGCLGIFYAVIFLTGSVVSNVTGFSFSDLGIPGWVIWLLLTWFYVGIITSERSFHEINVSWYFPRLGWISSFLFAAYIIGFVQLLIAVSAMETGSERLIAFLLVWLGYLTPFVLFLSAINIGHGKLMEKRQLALNQPRTDAAS